MSGAYYNENDLKAAAWLRELIRDGHIAAGDVDERSIADVQPDDLRGYAQCHFFAGIGGWSYALRLAGWPDDAPVWTGSCPCQPFSAAGKRKGTADERHLWPEFQRLIAECNPAIVFGEQVASKDGRLWLAGVRADLEALGYAVGAADLCAAGVGAPHIRQRLYWLADSGSERREGIDALLRAEASRQLSSNFSETAGSGATSGMADARCERIRGERCGATESASSGVQGANGERQRVRLDAWTEHSVVPCLDGKARRFEPGSFPLAHGLPARVGRLRGYGNAIVPQVAAELISAYAECGE